MVKDTRTYPTYSKPVLFVVILYCIRDLQNHFHYLYKIFIFIFFGPIFGENMDAENITVVLYDNAMRFCHHDVVKNRAAQKIR